MTATHFLAKSFIKVKYASLVNLIAEREVVPELLQYNAIPANISQEVLKLLEVEKNKTMRQKLSEVCSLLGETGASRRTAKLALEMISKN